jgi:hypothetical protein
VPLKLCSHPMRELLDQVNKGTFIDPSRHTLAEFLDRWGKLGGHPGLGQDA